MSRIGEALLRIRAVTVNAAGGPARARVALTLAAVLAVNGADVGTVAATTGNLERAFGVGNTQIGLLLTVVSLTAAAFTLPAGILTDRVRRTRLLSGSIAAWAVATVVSGAASSYWWLLVARIALGVVTATAGPAVASLTGDYFPAADRARIYGLITGGDLAGSGLGYLVSGDLSSLTTWRAAFWWLAVPSLVLAWLVWRLPEPARGGASRIAAGATEIPAERDTQMARDRGTKAGTRHQGRDPGGGEPAFARQAVSSTGARPQEDLVLREDPARRPVWWAVRYVLRVRTNVVIIIASALGYFYFAGLRSFAIIFATGHYGISKPTATFLILVIGGGALVGVFVGGRGADRLLHRGHLRARVILPAASLLVLPFVLAPAIATRSVAVALPLLIVGAFLLGAPNPALDAARLDIMPPGLWGRAEAVRTVLRSGGEATAPLLFGYVSQYVFGGPGAASGDGGSGGAPAGNAAGLEYTFLLFLGVLLIAGLLALAGLRTYPRDVATAAASAEAIGQAAVNNGRQRAPSMAQRPGRGDSRRSVAERLNSRWPCTSAR
jgi:predicted MFS family arabinose efflux permease